MRKSVGRWGRLLLLSVLVGCRDDARGSVDPPEVSLLPPSAILPVEFTRILSVRELPSGQVLITDPNENRIIRADFQTGVAEAIGQVGDGPGEFRQAGTLWAVTEDSTIMMDRGARRWLVFEGTRITSIIPSDAPAVLASSRGRVDGMDQQGSLVARVTHWDPSVRVVSLPDSLFVVRIDRLTGSSQVLARAAEIQPQASPAASPSGGTLPERQRYFMSLHGTDRAVAFPDGWIAIARSSPYRIDWCAPDLPCVEGPALSASARSFTDADKAAVLALAKATATWPPTTDVDETVGWPETIPPFVITASVVEGTALHASPDGRLLVHRVPTGDAPATRYDIIGRAGEIESRLRVQAQEQIVGFGTSSVYVAVTDAFGIRRLQRHPWQ